MQNQQEDGIASENKSTWPCRNQFQVNNRKNGRDQEQKNERRKEKNNKKEKRKKSREGWKKNTVSSRCIIYLLQ